jgi:hypothetical protein
MSEGGCVAFSARSCLQRLHRTFALLAIFIGILALPPAAHAHVGSPDIYVEGNAGPYRLLITIRPPQVIPGIAEIEVRATGSSSLSPQISSIDIAPIPLTGEASKHPPVADQMKQSSQDRGFYTGGLWIMASGSWQVRFTVNGSKGSGVLSIPVPATASSTQGMQVGLGILLSALGLLLIVGIVGIAGAAARDAQLMPGTSASPSSRKRAVVAMTVALVLMIAAVILGRLWWNGEADDYAKYVYKPLTMEAILAPDHTLHLKVKDPGWLKSRKLDDFVLDHDHLMHLYLIRQPGMDIVYHLHPDQVATGEFQLALPSIPAGTYRLYADVVHANGFPETLVASMTFPGIEGRPLAGDDAHGIIPPLSQANLFNGCLAGPLLGSQFHLPDGYSMVWNNPSTLPAKRPEIFEFTLLDAAGNPAQDTALYMGMLGHAAFVKDDGSVFAHVHPSGTASMAALMMAEAQNHPSDLKKDGIAAMPEMDGMDSDDEVVRSEKTRSIPAAAAHSQASTENPGSSGLPNQVGFPYGFPTAGAYRIFVQMKHGQTIETGAFDACATTAAAN